MKEIKLSQGKFALVDDEDFDFINQWKWFATNSRGIFYAIRAKMNMHRMIMNAPKGMDVDHINHNGLDNRKENLKICTHRENMINRKQLNKTGYVGVTKSRNGYMAMLTYNGEKIYLGQYWKAVEAHNAYMIAVNKIIKNG